MIVPFRFCKRYSVMSDCKQRHDDICACDLCPKLDTVLLPVCNCCMKQIEEDDLIEDNGRHYHKEHARIGGDGHDSGRP